MGEEIKEQNPIEMNIIDDLFKIGDEEPYTMTQKEFVEKTKSLLEKIYSGYLQGWQSRVLFDEEYPEESICDKCTGCGIFLENGEERDCVQDREWGGCFHRFCDYEQVGMELETHLGDIVDLLSVDKVIDTE
jgi:hypothetical protein